MALSIEDKKQIVTDVAELAKESSSLVIADARGLNVSEANDLRSEGYKANVKFKVAKNSLVKLGLKGSNYEGMDDYLNGPTNVSFFIRRARCCSKNFKIFCKKE